MKCNSCGKEIHYGYFWEGESVQYICTDCLLSYKEKSMNKYDHEMIMKLYKEGIPNDRIATIMGTNPLTIACIIRKELKREQNKVYQHRRFKTEEED